MDSEAGEASCFSSSGGMVGVEWAELSVTRNSLSFSVELEADILWEEYGPEEKDVGV